MVLGFPRGERLPDGGKITGPGEKAGRGLEVFCGGHKGSGSELEVPQQAAPGSICSTVWWSVVLNHTKSLRTEFSQFYKNRYAKAAWRPLLGTHPSKARLLCAVLRTIPHSGVWARGSPGSGESGGQTRGSRRPHLAQLHEEVGDPSLDAFPEGVVLRPAGAGGEGSSGPAPPAPWPSRTHRPLHL